MDTTVATTGKELYKTIIRTSNNEIIADEPIDLGGKDLGFNPGELMTASLGSCTSITLRMYANRKEWEIDEIKVEVDLNNEDKNHPIIYRTIQVKGNLDEKQSSRLLAIANACPMHKLLEKGIEIQTKIN